MNARRCIFAAFLLASGLSLGWFVTRPGEDAPHTAVAASAGAPSRQPPWPAPGEAPALSSHRPRHAASAGAVAKVGSVQTDRTATVAPPVSPVPRQIWWYEFNGTTAASDEPQDGKQVLTAYLIWRKPQ